MFVLKVEESFDAAHWLRDYEGDCARLHGHHWTVEMSVAGEELGRGDLLIDFVDVKSFLRATLAALDHRCINEVPPFDVLSPTSENLARYLFGELKARLGQVAPQLRLTQVRVSESPSTAVVYTEGGPE